MTDDDSKPKKPFKQRVKDFFWGSEDAPLPVFSTRAKFKRWYLIHFKNYVYLITTIYNSSTDEYTYCKDIVHRKELSPDAVHVTNQKFTYHIDLDLKKRGFSSEKDFGFTAVDAFLYMKCNKIDEAMKVDLDKPGSNMDTNKIIIIIAIVIGVAFGIYYMMG